MIDFDPHDRRRAKRLAISVVAIAGFIAMVLGVSENSWQLAIPGLIIYWLAIIAYGETQ
jgi:hypothetical protein